MASNNPKLNELEKELIMAIDKSYKEALENKSELFECRACRQKPSYLFKFKGSKQGFYFCKKDLGDRIGVLALATPYLAEFIYGIIGAVNSIPKVVQ